MYICVYTSVTKFVVHTDNTVLQIDLRYVYCTLYTSFNRLVLQSLKSCHHRSKRVGECFLQKVWS